MAIIRIWSLWAAVAVSALSTLLLLSTTAVSFETRTLEFLCGQPRGSANREICGAYISGVIDGIALGRLRAGCLPQITDTTAPEVVIDYLTKHPEKHFEKDASGVVYQALLESFQCKP
jgi:Rap1a immunity proteins